MIQPTTSRAYHSMGAGLPPAKMWVSKSLLWKFAPSPFAWKEERDAGIGFKPTDATDWGNLLDCRVTSPLEFLDVAAVGNFKDWRAKEAGAFRDAARAEGKIPFLQCKMAGLELAAKRMREHLAQAINGEIQYQVQMTTEIEVGGDTFNCKGLADILVNGRFLHDIKTTGQGLELRNLRNKIADMGYHCQAAWYIDLMRANGVDTPDTFGLHFQESEFPYRTRTVMLDAADIAAGRAWYNGALSLWAYCSRSDDWPGQIMEPIIGGLSAYAKGGSSYE